MIGGLLGEILFQALLFFIILRLIAKHEADYDFGKLAMLSAVITMCTTVLTLLAADRGLIYIPAGYTAAVVVATWLLVKFCWVPVWKALIAVVTVIALKAVVRFLILMLLARALGGPAAGTPAAAAAPAAPAEKRASAQTPDEVRLREIHGWLRWQVSLSEQLAAAKKICDSQTPPVEITGSTALVVAGSDGKVPVRSGRLQVTGRAGGNGVENAAAVLNALSEHAAVKPDGIKVHPQRMVQDPVDARFTIFTLNIAYPPRFLLADAPPALEPAAEEAAGMILPAGDPATAASNAVAAAATAAGFQLTRLSPLPVFSAPGPEGKIALLPVLIAGRGPWNSVIEILRALESNRGLQIEKMALRPLTNGKDWEMSVRFEQAAWKPEGP
ncbi:MAG TPA: hypothetical protein PKM67_01065 [Kiritimatiellia bacterium]|nr:hypothetical protein [Kiritimatiellia bacterium]HNS80033.1 hypothetical protein [Kiritimatiellia bacterium]HPA77963.1 hypothetical protein [Kiritimatiellia bacterium]HQQ03831.1 hypothetical protein [Kiritimatiellia bacterium]